LVFQSNYYVHYYTSAGEFTELLVCKYKFERESLGVEYVQ